LRRNLLRAPKLHHPSRLHLPELHQNFLRILQQRALKKSQRKIFFEALQDDDVLPVDGKSRLPPFALFRHRQSVEHAPHLRNLRPQETSTRHLHGAPILNRLKRRRRTGTLRTVPTGGRRRLAGRRLGRRRIAKRNRRRCASRSASRTSPLAYPKRKSGRKP